ncbi:MAG: (S)-ureidoglycine aminohydrolase [Rhizobiales bacterium]|nr:(S)-ureidoglycine aminohydrolase [Hyphomicrobiales bacterium]
MHPRDIPVKPGRIRPGAFGHNRGVVKSNYAIMPPEGVMDSYLPNWEKTTIRFQAAPQLGARFAQALIEIEPGGGTRAPIADALERFLFVMSGAVDLAIEGLPPARLEREGFAYVPPGVRFSLASADGKAAAVNGLKRPYEPADGFDVPEPIVSRRADVPVVNRNGTEGRGWQHLLPYGDMRFDMEMNILSFAPGTYFPDVETHINEHGLVMLEGQGMYLLGEDWHEVWAGDFIWMGPYCPQLFYPTGWEPSAYLLYKDVNRDVRF